MRATGPLCVLHSNATLSVNAFSYIAACNICICLEQWNRVERLTGPGQRSLFPSRAGSRPFQSSSATPNWPPRFPPSHPSNLQTDIWIRSDPHMKLQLSRMMCLFFCPVRGVRRGAPTRPRHRPLRSSVRFPLAFSFISRPSARSFLKSGMSTVKKASRSVLRTIMVAHFGTCVAFICSPETFFTSYPI